jgi:hypothetical protein
MTMAELLTDRKISHEEARQIAQRLINSAFRNGKDEAHFEIPANKERDDDLLIMAYIHQQATSNSATVQMIERQPFMRHDD